MCLFSIPPCSRRRFTATATKIQNKTSYIHVPVTVELCFGAIFFLRCLYRSTMYVLSVFVNTSYSYFQLSYLYHMHGMGIIIILFNLFHCFSFYISIIMLMYKFTYVYVYSSLYDIYYFQLVYIVLIKHLRMSFLDLFCC